MAMRGGMGMVAAGAAGLLTGVIALKGAFGAADSAGEFQQGIAGIGAVTNATTAQLGALRNAAIDAGIATQFSPGEAVDGLRSLATAGQTVEQSTRTLIPVLDLAAGSLGQLGVEGAAEAVVGTLNSYQMSADQAADVTDRLLRITQLTNFQARDFSAGLSKAAAAGAVFDQSLNDTLITMGLMRNANIDASSASTAFRESVRRLGSDKNAQKSLEGLVEIFDEAGEMRGVVDIMQDLSDATADQTDKERNATVARAFGARGLLAFNAVSKATYTTMRDGVEVTLEGREAIEALREEMDGATGSAERMREQLLDTFAGQKQLLSGTLETLGIVLGEGFATVLKPVVGGLVDALNAVLQFFNDLPEPVKKAVSGFILVAGAAFVLFGAFTIIAGIITILLPMMMTMIAVMAVMSLVLLPIAAGFLAVGAAIGFFVVAARNNIGGFGDRMRQLWDDIKLGFNAIVQLFSQGGFSGAVYEEMQKAENSGIRSFALSVYGIGSRILEFFRGLKAGFMAVMEDMAPAFKALGEAIDEVGNAFGLTGAAINENLGPMEESQRTGARVGVTLGNLFRLLVKGATFAARAFAGFINGVRDNWHRIEPAIEGMKESFSTMGDAINGFAAESEDNIDKAGEGAGGLGRTLGSAFVTAAGLMARFVGSVADTVTFFVRIGRAIGRQVERADIMMTEFALGMEETWFSVVETIRNALDWITVAIGDAVSALPANVRTPQMNAMIASGEQAEQRIARRPAEAVARASVGQRIRGDLAQRRADVEAEARAAEASDRDDRVLGNAMRGLAESQRQERTSDREIVLVVDGEAIARASAKGARDSNERGFRPVPAENAD